MVFRRMSQGYVGFVEDLPAANTQGRTLAETRENLLQAIRQVLEVNRRRSEACLEGEEVIREPLSLANL
jgi:predicted RNase H-like HicB family nuclease